MNRRWFIGAALGAAVLDIAPTLSDGFDGLVLRAGDWLSIDFKGQSPIFSEVCVTVETVARETRYIRNLLGNSNLPEYDKRFYKAQEQMRIVGVACHTSGGPDPRVTVVRG